MVENLSPRTLGEQVLRLASFITGLEQEQQGLTGGNSE